MLLNPFLRSQLFDDEPDSAGGVAIDPGAPFEHGDGPIPKEPVLPSETADAKALKALQAEVAGLKKRADEAEEDSRYWSRRAQENRTAPAREADEPVRRREPAAEPAEKPEKLIDELSTEGVSALKKRGIITQEALDQALEEHAQKTETRISQARSDAEFGAKLAQLYPEIAADSERVERGERPQTELFKRTGELYRKAVATDPSLKGSQGLLLIVAERADEELKAKAKAEKADKAKPPKEEDDEVLPQERPRRRDRIAAQQPERGRQAEESAGDPGFDREQLQVMKQLGVKPEEFRKHSNATPAGGRRNGR